MGAAALSENTTSLCRTPPPHLAGPRPHTLQDTPSPCRTPPPSFQETTPPCRTRPSLQDSPPHLAGAPSSVQVAGTAPIPPAAVARTLCQTRVGIRLAVLATHPAQDLGAGTGRWGVAGAIPCHRHLGTGSFTGIAVGFAVHAADG